jgi:hypothetical protein
VLKSARGVNYSRLQQLLAAGNWKEADQETTKVMLQVAGREREGRLRIEDIDNFPCEDLRTINQLWLDYSNGKFGFSVQKEIYESLGGTREYNQKVWEKFGNRVGWRKGGIFKDWRWLSYGQLTFNSAAPKAHLPGYIFSASPKTHLPGYSANPGKHTPEWMAFVCEALGKAIFSRAKTCKL